MRRLAVFLGAAGAAIAVVASGQDLVGTWSSPVSGGGLGTELVFTGNGSVRATFGAMVDQEYSIIEQRGEQMVVEAHFGTAAPVRWLIEIDGNRLVQRPLVGGGKLELKRARAGHTGGQRLVGLWRGRHASGRVATTEFTSDGRLRFRLPMRHREGTYRRYGEHIDIRWAGPGAATTALRQFGSELRETTRDGTERVAFLRCSRAAKSPRVPIRRPW